jgi:hypothetical protein
MASLNGRLTAAVHSAAALVTEFKSQLGSEVTQDQCLAVSYGVLAVVALNTQRQRVGCAGLGAVAKQGLGPCSAHVP